MGTFRAGVAIVDITPPLDIPLAGSIGTRYPSGVKTPLKAQALFLTDGKGEVACISVDLCALHHEDVAKVRSMVERRAGIPGENMLITATHNHFGPQTYESFLGAGGYDENYNNVLNRKMADAVVMAKKNSKPAKIGIGAGREGTIAFNRRLRLTDGRVVMNFNTRDREVLKGAQALGPIDPEVLVIRIDSVDDIPLAVVVNYALHNITCGGNDIHPDFAGYMGDVVRKVLGQEVLVPFLPGACGNINHINFQDPNQPNLGMANTYLIAKVLAGEVLKVHTKIQTSDKCQLGVVSKTLRIPDRGFTPADDMLETSMGGHKSAFLREWEEIKKTRIAEDFPVEVQALRIGDSAIVANPAEYFVEFGLKIKEESPFKHTLVSELSNGYAGYVCTKDAFTQGGYEPLRTIYTSHLSVDAGDKIAETSIGLLKELYR